MLNFKFNVYFLNFCFSAVCFGIFIKFLDISDSLVEHKFLSKTNFCFRLSQYYLVFHSLPFLESPMFSVRRAKNPYRMKLRRKKQK